MDDINLIINSDFTNDINADSIKERLSALIEIYHGFGFHDIKIKYIRYSTPVILFVLTHHEKPKQLKKIEIDLNYHYPFGLLHFEYAGNETLLISEETGNDKVSLHELIKSNYFKDMTFKALPWIIGYNDKAEPLILSLANIGNVLIIGTSGVGKTSIIDNLLASIMYKDILNKVRYMFMSNNPTSFYIYKDYENVDYKIASTPKDISNNIQLLCYEIRNRQNFLISHGCRSFDGYSRVYKDLYDSFDKTFNKIIVIIENIDTIQLKLDEYEKSELLHACYCANSVGIHIVMSLNYVAKSSYMKDLLLNMNVNICLSEHNVANVNFLDGNVIGKSDMIVANSNSDCVRNTRFYKAYMDYSKIYDAINGYLDFD